MLYNPWNEVGWYLRRIEAASEFMFGERTLCSERVSLAFIIIIIQDGKNLIFVVVCTLSVKVMRFLYRESKDDCSFQYISIGYNFYFSGIILFLLVIIF